MTEGSQSREWCGEHRSVLIWCSFHKERHCTHESSVAKECEFGRVAMLAALEAVAAAAREYLQTRDADGTPEDLKLSNAVGDLDEVGA